MIRTSGGRCIRFVPNPRERGVALPAPRRAHRGGRGPLGGLGHVTPHLQLAEALAADTTRCLSHAAGIYAFNTNQPDTAMLRLASTGTTRPAA
jgi:hypothetical protein